MHEEAKHCVQKKPSEMNSFSRLGGLHDTKCKLGHKLQCTIVHKYETSVNGITCSCYGKLENTFSTRGGEKIYPQSSILCSLLFLLIFSATEKTRVIYLNDKVGGGIQFVSHCAALCRSRVYCGQTRKKGAAQVQGS